jgi:hypothetical protein
LKNLGGKDAKTVNVHLKLSLRAGVKNKSLKQSKGTGASGSFKIGEVVKPKTITCDNGPEYISQALRDWAQGCDIELRYIQSLILLGTLSASGLSLLILLLGLILRLSSNSR